MHWNLNNDEEFRSLKFLKLKYRRGDQIIQTFSRIDSPKEIRSPLFNLEKFKKSDKSFSELYRAHWNVIQNKKFGSLKVGNLK